MTDRNSDTAKGNLKLACLGIPLLVFEWILISIYVEGANAAVVGDAVSKFQEPNLQERVIYLSAFALPVLLESVLFFRACRQAKSPMIVLAMVVSGGLALTFVWMAVVMWTGSQ